RILMT
ncbi:hypothetical protein D046_5622C, partial [Vibrio parahaemolyticus V-223/04]